MQGQIGRPAEVYEAPNSRYVADFIGDVNLFEGRVVSADAWNVSRTAIRQRQCRPLLGGCGPDLGLAVRSAALRLCDSADQGRERPGAAIQIWRRDIVLKRFQSEAEPVRLKKTRQRESEAF